MPEGVNVLSSLSMVRFAVLAYLVLGAWVAISLWRNPAAPNSLQTAGVLLAALLPALIAVLPLSTPTELKREYNLVIFFDEESKQVVQTHLFSPYLTAYFHLFAGLAPSDLKSREIKDEEVPEGSGKQYWPTFHKEKGLDLIERLMLMTFVNENHMRWDIEYQSHATPLGVSREGKFGEQKFTTINVAKLSPMLEHNQLFRGKPIIHSWPSFTVPPGSKFSVQGDNQSRTISIDITHHDSLTISISPSSAGVAPSGVWGLLPPNKSLIALQYRTIVKLKYRPHATDGQVLARWFENTSAMVAKLDWATIDSELERTLMRKKLGGQN